MVKRGIGWALIPEIALDNFEGIIRPCFLENGEPLIRRTYLLCNREAAVLPQIREFMNLVKERKLI